MKAVVPRVRQWARKRQGRDVAPVKLGRRRIYILPTSFGAIYGAVVFAMLLGSMNYNNSMGFALTFLLTGLGFVAMHHCHRNLSGLIVSGVQTGEAFAGEPMKMQVGLENPTALRRIEIAVECSVSDSAGAPERSPVPVYTVAPASRVLAAVEVPTHRRGVLRAERLTLSSRFPFGLFRAWSWVYLPIEALVYPRPEGDQPPPPDTTTERNSAGSNPRGTEDFRGFRSYVPGDSPRHIAWKALARGAPLMVKEYAGADRTPVILDFSTVRQPDVEARLSQLCSWVLEAERGSRLFGLRLPGKTVGLQAGAAQRRRCLDALALFDEERAP